mmetsp:Transcript_52097/g.156330  ORF Transcript_52097/g.156330 Transcript_52097/m.156330 type:complete len:319 (+) Transcript_52097:2269-3225(+)
MSRWFTAHASSSIAGRDSSSFWAARAACSASMSPIPGMDCWADSLEAPSTAERFEPERSPPLSFFLSAACCCTVSTSLYTFCPARTALIPELMIFMLVDTAFAFFLARAAWPSSPRNDVWKPRNSSASTCSANPMVTRYTFPKADPAIFSASSLAATVNVSLSWLPSSYGRIRSRTFRAHLTSLLRCFSFASADCAARFAMSAAIFSSASVAFSSASICSCCSMASFMTESAVVAIHNSPMYGSTRCDPNMTAKKTKGSISLAMASVALPELGGPFLSYAARLCSLERIWYACPRSWNLDAAPGSPGHLSGWTFLASL